MLNNETGGRNCVSTSVFRIVFVCISSLWVSKNVVKNDDVTVFWGSS